MATARKQTKEVTVLARVQFKNDPRKAVYRVLSSDGVNVYNTYFFNGKATSCECPATRRCYHMAQCEAKEQARSAVAIENASANLRYAYGYHD